MSLPTIAPMPERAGPSLPRIGAGLSLLRGPTAFFERARRRHGDTFVVDAFGYRLLCVFSPLGVRNLWALRESEASKGLADYALLRHKVPDELFAGRRTRPHDLFRRDDVSEYLSNLEQAVADQIAEQGTAGRVELFALTRRLGHRVGLASWGGIAGAGADALDRLIPSLDQLDSSESFVHPHRGLRAVLTRKRAERRALARLDAAFADLAARRRAHPTEAPDLFDRICEAWSDVDGPDRDVGIARDVVLVHMGSQSNLFAAMAWTLVHLLERPALLEQVRSGDSALLDRVAHETIRLRQRSIVLRQVLRPLTLADEKTAYRLERGAFVATMLSVTNPSAAPGLEHFDPDHYQGARLADADALPARELVTTFGHGRHSCPAQGFSIAAIRHAVSELVARYSFTPRYRDPQPLRRQLGGIARADRACHVDYILRAPR